MASALYVRRLSLNLILDLIATNALKAYLTWSSLGQGNSVHAANLFYIFRNNRTTKNHSGQGDCSLEHWPGKL